MMQIRAERLAYWYLRLNGFLTTENFVVHPDSGSNQETDVDVMGIRFPYRQENLVDPMQDDTTLNYPDNKILIILGEVKLGECALNGPWTNRSRNNMYRVLMAIGAIKKDEAITVAEELYTKGYYKNDEYEIGLLLFGKHKNIDINERLPHIRQVTWNQILTFIFHRFKKYRRTKGSHGQWDSDVKQLWVVSQRLPRGAVEEFLNLVHITYE